MMVSSTQYVLVYVYTHVLMILQISSVIQGAIIENFKLVFFYNGEISSEIVIVFCLE